MNAKSATHKNEATIVRVFIPKARLLTGAEIQALPVKDKEPAGGEGLWVEVACPDESCTVDGGRICLPATSASTKKGKGAWLKIFCPEDRCYFDDASGLP
jgi:hypothetical protein